MKSLLSKSLKTVDKIVFSAMFIVLAMLLQKVAAVNYISFVPFLRVSFGGPAIIILASIWLGPIYGLIVGAASDVLGYFLFDPRNNAFFPQITAIYALLGFLSYFVFRLIKSVKSYKKMFILETSFLTVLFTIITIYLLMNDSIKLYSSTYDLEVWHKLLIIFGVLLIITFVIVFTYIYWKKTKDKYLNNSFNVYQISFACFFLELIVMLLFGSLMKGLAFGFSTFTAIILCQTMVLFINIALNIVFLSIFINIIEKYA